MDAPVRKDLYPHVEPYQTGRLKVSDVHTIYYEQSGNPGGHVSITFYPLPAPTSTRSSSPRSAPISLPIN
jgi:proline iminopeptidase